MGSVYRNTVDDYLIYKHKTSPYVVESSVSHFPPEGLNSLELSYLYKGNLDYEDTPTLLLDLANKGYIK